MAGLLFSVILLEAERPDILTPQGAKSFEDFEEKSEALLKDAMSAARKMLRQAAPVRTRKLQRAFRVSKVRRKKVRDLDVVVGFRVSAGSRRRIFYASITEARAGTRVSNWFSNVLDEIVSDREFTDIQREIVTLYANAVRTEYYHRTSKSIEKQIKVDFPKARVVSIGDGFKATVRLGRG